jgi:ATP-dependent Lhr-like helicase
LVVLRLGRPLVWFDRRSHHLVTFPGALDHPEWTDALGALTKDGRLRSVEIRKVNGDTIAHAPQVAELLKRQGFVDSYRGLSLRP